MADKVKPLKIEQDQDGHYYTETDPANDYVACKGISFENTETHVIDIVNNEVAIKDPVSGTKTISQISQSDPYSDIEIIRDSNKKVTNIIKWTNNSPIQKIEETVITRENNKVSSFQKKIYADGVLTKTIEYTISRVNGRVSEIDGEEI